MACFLVTAAEAVIVTAVSHAVKTKEEKNEVGHVEVEGVKSFDLRFQPLDKADLLICLAAFHKLNNKHRTPETGFFDGLPQRCRRLSFSTSAIYLKFTLSHSTLSIPDSKQLAVFVYLTPGI